MSTMLCPTCGVGEIESPRHVSVGERIAWLRGLKGITQSDLADAVGITRCSISNIESGRHSPKIKQLGAYAKALGVSPADLIV